jgi:hypothetical protein
MSEAGSVPTSIEIGLLKDIEELCGIQNVGRKGFISLKEILDGNKLLYPPLGQRRSITQRVQRLKQKDTHRYEKYLTRLGIVPFGRKQESPDKLDEHFESLNISEMPVTRKSSRKKAPAPYSDDEDSSLTGKFSWQLLFCFLSFLIGISCFFRGSGQQQQPSPPKNEDTK